MQHYQFTTLLALLLTTQLSVAADRFANVQIETIKVTDNIYMLTGAGGNIGVSNGDDGVLMIDDQYRPMAEKIKAALAEINPQAPTFLLNTHYHGDHTGGNIEFGEDSIIMAHKNVRVRLLGDEALPEHALPMVTYTEAASIHFNGEEVALIHTGASHTDGDTIVHFTESNVVHMGDNFFRDMFPYVDLGAGGSVQGLMKTIRTVLEMVDAETQLIPGHGALAKKEDLARKLNMLEETSATVRSAVAAGKPLEEIVDAGLGEKWQSWSWGFINEERWIKTLYNEYK